MTDYTVTAGDLLISNGDWDVSESSQQEVQHILISDPGGWRQHPLLGGGFRDFVNGPADLAMIRRQTRLALDQDGFTAVQVALNDGQITINASR